MNQSVKPPRRRRGRNKSFLEFERQKGCILERNKVMVFILDIDGFSNMTSRARIFRSNPHQSKAFPPFHPPPPSAAFPPMTPRPKNSPTTWNRSLDARPSASLKSSCRSAASSCAWRKARMLRLVGAHWGHSTPSPPPAVEEFRQRWWKLCLQRKCTVGRSSVWPQEEHRRVWNTAGLLPSAASSSRLASVSAR